MALNEKLIEVINKLKVSKENINKFGGYKYRTCEDILEAVKPLLFEHKLLLNITDEVVSVGDRVYVKSTARIIDGDGQIESIGWARESLTKKGMDDSQITGASSSYARKYALNGLFCIDDAKDVDGLDQSCTKEQIRMIKSLNIDISKMLKHYKVGKIEDLTTEQAKEIIRIKTDK